MAEYTKWINQGGIIMTDKPANRKIVARIENNQAFTVEEVIANARLIAKAPEMYEALKAILNNCEFLGDEYALGDTVRINPSIELAEALQSAKQFLSEVEEK